MGFWETVGSAVAIGILVYLGKFVADRLFLNPKIVNLNFGQGDGYGRSLNVTIRNRRSHSITIYKGEIQFFARQKFKVVRRPASKVTVSGNYEIPLSLQGPKIQPFSLTHDVPSKGPELITLDFLNHSESWFCTLQVRLYFNENESFTSPLIAMAFPYPGTIDYSYSSDDDLHQLRSAKIRDDDSTATISILERYKVDPPPERDKRIPGSMRGSNWLPDRPDMNLKVQEWQKRNRRND